MIVDNPEQLVEDLEEVVLLQEQEEAQGDIRILGVQLLVWQFSLDDDDGVCSCGVSLANQDPNSDQEKRKSVIKPRLMW